MTSLNIDLRDTCLRILVVKEGTPRYSKLIKDFSLDDEKSSTERLASEIKEAGGKKGQVHIILPTDIVNYKTYKTPPLDIEDARKVIRRELEKELEGQDVSFSIRRIMKRASAGQQEMLIEYVLEADVMKYFNVLRSCRIRPDIMSSSLEGNTRIFNKQRPETDGNEAMIDIGTNIIEVSVFNNRDLLMYDRLSMQRAHDERPDKEVSFEHQDKMKTFKIVETLYQFIMRYSKDFPEEKLSLLWLCGTGSLAEGITDSLSDGLGVETRLIRPFETDMQRGSALSTLAGIATVPRDEPFMNLMPEDILEKKTRMIKRVLLAASLSLYIILLAGGSIVLNVLEKDLNRMHDKFVSEQALLANKQEAATVYSSNQGTYIKLVSGTANLYSVFRDIANLTPSGVVLENIDIENVNGATNLTIAAKIQYSDETFKNAVLSTFLTALDSSSRLRQAMPPEISVKETRNEQKEISVIAKYEVLQ